MKELWSEYSAAWSTPDRVVRHKILEKRLTPDVTMRIRRVKLPATKSSPITWRIFKGVIQGGALLFPKYLRIITAVLSTGRCKTGKVKSRWLVLPMQN